MALMLRTADEKWVYRFDRALYPLISYSQMHPLGAFSPIRAAAAAIAAHLAYCTIDDQERADVERDDRTVRGLSATRAPPGIVRHRSCPPGA
jgi:hypothetical protein